MKGEKFAYSNLIRILIGDQNEILPVCEEGKTDTLQVLVKYLQIQFSKYDGEQQRFIQGIWGIFGHGNVSGMSQALVEYGQEAPYHRPTNEQSMIYASCTG